MDPVEEESNATFEEANGNHGVVDGAAPEELQLSAREPAPPRQAIPISTKTQDLTSHTLQFLSTASNETLGACVVGFCATTYFFLGRLGLLLLGLIGGVVLHASWGGSSVDGSGGELRAREARRRELGIAVAQKVLDWREMKRTTEFRDVGPSADADATLSTQKELGFEDYQPATRAALKAFTDAVVRDYVKWWYDPILPNENTFPFTCRQTLNGFVLSISAHLSRKRPADTFLDFLTNASSIIIVFLNELSSALMASEVPLDSPADAVHRYLENNPESSLANVLSLKQQKKKLNLVADDILQNFVDSKVYNCDPMKVFLREIFAGVVLESTIQTTGRAEWINAWIIYLLEEGDPEILDAINAGVDSATPVQSGKASGHGTLNGIYTKEGRPPDMSKAKLAQDAGHRRRLSRAEDAMEQAMMEAKRLSEMIAAEEAGASQESIKTGMMDGMATPTSSDSDRNGSGEPPHEPLPQAHERSPPRIPQPTTPKTESNFTNFDQLSSWQPSTPVGSATTSRTAETPVFSLQHANVSIFDDSIPGEKAKISTDFLLQVEPASSQASGWMIPKKYQDFEILHEVLRRIWAISEADSIKHQYALLPTWKGKTKSALCPELEQYLQAALKYDNLANCQGMKTFLEKDQDLGRTTVSNNPAFGFPSPAAFETISKGVLDVLANAPKGIAGGGKAVLGGVTGVFGVVGGSGQKKPPHTGGQPRVRQDPLAVTNRARSGSVGSTNSAPRESQEGFGNSPEISRITTKSPLPRRPSDRGDIQTGQPTGSLSPSSNRSTTELSRSSLASLTTEEQQYLPPPPSMISDDYGSPVLIDKLPVGSSKAPDVTRQSAPKSEEPPQKPKLESAAMTEEETQIAIELFFAVIQELYTLSSAWGIRRTLLNAAKTFLLRPGNPNLESIRLLLQNSIIDAHTSDSGLAAHILKLRENTLPTEEELKSWPQPPSEAEKENSRLKARKLLIERGMPQALASVMGAAASGEALGRVFDCLQVEEVARGLMFALLLQALRAATQ